MLRLCRFIGFFYHWLIFAQEGLFFIIVIQLPVSGRDPIINNHPIDDIRNGDAIANGLYIFDCILTKETLKDAGDKIDHDPVSLLSQQRGKFNELEHPLLVDYQWGAFGNWGRLFLNVLTKLGGKEENWMGEDGR